MKYLLLLMLSGIVYNAAAQNKVPNPSFETMVNCPQIMGAPQDPPGASGTVEHWFKAGIGSTDFYNTCSNGPNDIPLNAKGYQQPRTGNGYAGFYAIADQYLASREYLQCELNTPLIAGHHYLVSFWVALADSNANGLKASDEVAAYFSNDFIVVGTPQISNVTPQVKQTAGDYLSDTLNWVRLQDTLAATGIEDHMLIGVFSAFAAQSYQVIDGPPLFYQIYYYIDDVCVVDLDETDLIETFDTAVCEGAANIQLTARAGMETYEWSNGAATQQTTVFTSGTYWVKSFGNCEMRIDTFHVSLFADSGNVNLGNDTAVCFNSNLVLNAYNPGFTSYLWNTGATASQIAVTASGMYAVRVTSDCGTFTDTINVVVKPAVPSLPAVDTIICAGISGSLIIYFEGINIRWYDTASGQVYNRQPVMDISKAAVYEYWVTQTIDGCESGQSKVKVVVLQLPDDILKDTAACNGAAIWLGADRDALQYLWDNGSDTCCILVDKSGVYHLKVSNFCGDVYDSAQVSILDNCDDCLWVPTAFTPNADGLNDMFEVRGLCPFKHYNLSVYNRFGERVFTAANNIETWDGTFHNAPCDVGAYFYYIEATPDVGDRAKIIKKGSVTLLR